MHCIATYTKLTLVGSEQTSRHGVEDLIGSIEGVVPSGGVAVCEVNPALV